MLLEEKKKEKEKEEREKVARQTRYAHLFTPSEKGSDDDGEADRVAQVAEKSMNVTKVSFMGMS